VLGAMVFLGERATAAVLAGGVLVIAGVLVTGDSPNGGTSLTPPCNPASGCARPKGVKGPLPPKDEGKGPFTPNGTGFRAAGAGPGAGRQGRGAEAQGSGASVPSGAMWPKIWSSMVSTCGSSTV
jgi:hypothetical protein